MAVLMGVWVCGDVCHWYSDIIISATASQITNVSIVCSTVCSGADQRKNQISASLAFVRRINRWPVDSPHKGPVTRKIFPFDDVIMRYRSYQPVPKHYKTQTRTVCAQFVRNTEHDYFILQLSHSVDVLVQTHADKAWIITVLFLCFTTPKGLTGEHLNFPPTRQSNHRWIEGTITTFLVPTYNMRLLCNPRWFQK